VKLHKHFLHNFWSIILLHNHFLFDWFVFIVLQAQRLAAQPLGRFRFVVTILAGIPQSQSSVLSLSLGQSLPPRSFSGDRLQPRVGPDSFF
jgi:hypothetical protein